MVVAWDWLCYRRCSLDSIEDVLDAGRSCSQNLPTLGSFRCYANNTPTWLWPGPRAPVSCPALAVPSPPTLQPRPPIPPAHPVERHPIHTPFNINPPPSHPPHPPPTPPTPHHPAQKNQPHQQHHKPHPPQSAPYTAHACRASALCRSRSSLVLF